MTKANTFRLLLVVMSMAFVALPALAAGGSNHLSADLISYQEVPALQSNAVGHIDLDISGSTVTYKLTFSNLRADATQSHIHIGQAGVNGGVTVFFCSNLGNGPAGTPACPLRGGTLSGTFGASNVLPITSQGIGAGDISSVLKALRNGVAYANIHSTQFPGGEIRGQIHGKGKNLEFDGGLGLEDDGDNQ